MSVLSGQLESPKSRSHENKHSKPVYRADISRVLGNAYCCECPIGLISITNQVMKITDAVCECGCGKSGTHNAESNYPCSWCLAAAQLRLLCNGKSVCPVSKPAPPVHAAGTSPNIQMPLHKLQINYCPRTPTILSLSALAASVALLCLQGHLPMFLLIGLTSQIGFALGVISTIWSGTISCRTGDYQTEDKSNE
jgi:hypothetical protein